MRLFFKDKAGELYTLNSDAFRVQERGGHGRQVFDPKGPLRMLPRLFVHLLPGQSVLLTCPECKEQRAFEEPGQQHVNLICEECSA